MGSKSKRSIERDMLKYFNKNLGKYTSKDKPLVLEKIKVMEVVPVFNEKLWTTQYKTKNFNPWEDGGLVIVPFKDQIETAIRRLNKKGFNLRYSNGRITGKNKKISKRELLALREELKEVIGIKDLEVYLANMPATRKLLESYRKIKAKLPPELEKLVKYSGPSSMALHMTRFKDELLERKKENEPEPMHKLKELRRKLLSRKGKTKRGTRKIVKGIYALEVEKLEDGILANTSQINVHELLVIAPWKNHIVKAVEKLREAGWNLDYKNGRVISLANETGELTREEFLVLKHKVAEIMGVDRIKNLGTYVKDKSGTLALLGLYRGGDESVPVDIKRLNKHLGLKGVVKELKYRVRTKKGKVRKTRRTRTRKK